MSDFEHFIAPYAANGVVLHPALLEAGRNGLGTDILPKHMSTHTPDRAFSIARAAGCLLAKQPDLSLTTAPVSPDSWPAGSAAHIVGSLLNSEHYPIHDPDIATLKPGSLIMNTCPDAEVRFINLLSSLREGDCRLGCDIILDTCGRATMLRKRERVKTSLTLRPIRMGKFILPSCSLVAAITKDEHAEGIRPVLGDTPRVYALSNIAEVAYQRPLLLGIARGQRGKYRDIVDHTTSSEQTIFDYIQPADIQEITQTAADRIRRRYGRMTSALLLRAGEHLDAKPRD